MTRVTLILNRDGKEERQELESLNIDEICKWLGISGPNTFGKNFQLKAKKKPKNTYEVVPNPRTVRVQYGQTVKEVRVEEVMSFRQLKRRVAELFQLPDLDQLRLYEHELPLPDDDSPIQNQWVEDVTITAQVDRRVTLHIQLNGETINPQFWLSDTWKTVRQEVATRVKGQDEYVLLARNDQVIDRTSTQTLKDAGVMDNDTVVAAYRPSVKCIFSIEQESGESSEESVTLKPWDTVKRAKEVLMERLKMSDEDADLTLVCAGSVLEDEMVLEDLLEDGDTLAITVNIERDSCVFIHSMRGSPILD